MDLNKYFYVEPDLQTQLVVLCFWAAVWKILLPYFCAPMFKSFIERQPWADQWNKLSTNTMEKSLFIKFDDPEVAREMNYDFCAILCQHGLGGALCIPSALGYQGAFVWALASHGALSEAGWELQDILTRIYQITMTKDGKSKNPTSLLVFLGLHHAMGMSMVIPMNMNYHDNKYYHEFVFLLQGAAFVALFLSNYGYSLDIKTASGLHKMKVSVFISFATIVWSRVVRYAWLGSVLLSTLSHDGFSYLFYHSIVILGLMGLVNMTFFFDVSKKMIKFMPMHHKDEEVEEHAHNMLVATHHMSSMHRIILAKPKTEWAKVRSAVFLSSLKKAASNKKE